MEVVTDDDASNAELPNQDIADELLGRERRERRVEGQHDHRIDAEPRQRRSLGLGRRQAKDRIGAKKIVARVRLEGQHRARPAEPRRDGKRAP